MRIYSYSARLRDGLRSKTNLLAGPRWTLVIIASAISSTLPNLHRIVIEFGAEIDKWLSDGKDTVKRAAFRYFGPMIELLLVATSEATP